MIFLISIKLRKLMSPLSCNKMVNRLAGMGVEEIRELLTCSYSILISKQNSTVT